MIGSTHSYHIIDSLPRVARKLIIRENESHRVIGSPTTMLALAEISDQQNKELLIICEDSFAGALLATAFPAEVRKRVDIQACGSQSELARYARSHLRVAQRARCLIVWDGDVTDAKIDNYLSNSKAQIPEGNVNIGHRLFSTRLPGTVPPEKWALETSKSDGIDYIISEFGLNSVEQAKSLLDKCSLNNVHNITYELALASGLNESNAAQCLVRCSVNAKRNEFQPIIDLIIDILDKPNGI